MVISIKEWRKVVWHESGQVFNNLRIGELNQLGFKKEDTILFKTKVVQPNKMLFTFRRDGEPEEPTSEQEEIMGNTEVIMEGDNKAIELLEKVHEEEEKMAEAEHPDWKLSDVIDVL